MQTLITLGVLALLAVAVGYGIMWLADVLQHMMRS